MQAQRAHIKAVSFELGYFVDGGRCATIVLHDELQADTQAALLPWKLRRPVYPSSSRNRSLTV